MSRRLPTLLLVAAIIAALLVPAVTAGATPSASPSSAQGGIEVRVPNFVFDPLLDGEPKLSNAERFDGQEAGLRLVQFYGPTQDAWLDGLQSAGLQGSAVLPALHLPGVGRGQRAARGRQP